MEPGPGAAVVSLRNASKRFEAIVALRGANLDVLPGEIHALLGENGSGKSTLVKILAGYHEPDGDTVLEVRGTPVALPLSPGQATELGLSFVHQDLGLVGNLSILENMRATRYQTGPLWRISWNRERAAVREALARFGVDHDPDTLVDLLGPIDRALVAIARSFRDIEHHPSGLLVLDEPTAYLPRDGAKRLFAAIDRATAAGAGVLLVTHRLEDVRAHADRVTILRDGRVVAMSRLDELDDGEMIELILGRSRSAMYQQPERSTATGIALSVSGLSGGTVRDLSFELRQGEVLGVTGLAGTGWEDVGSLLFGGLSATSGRLRIGAREFAAPQMSPRKAIAAGLAYLPARGTSGSGLGTALVSENVTLPTVRRYFRGGILRKREERRSLLGLIQRYDVRPPLPSLPLGQLSGGNQQKALFAKWFDTAPAVMILHEPVGGVDVGAKEQLFGHLRAAAAGGVGILVLSAEYLDLANLCDRVIVLRDGRVTAELPRESLAENAIFEACMRSDLAA